MANVTELSVPSDLSPREWALGAFAPTQLPSNELFGGVGPGPKKFFFLKVVNSRRE